MEEREKKGEPVSLIHDETVTVRGGREKIFLSIKYNGFILLKECMWVKVTNDHQLATE